MFKRVVCHKQKSHFLILIKLKGIINFMLLALFYWLEDNLKSINKEIILEKMI